ncbi:hydro-lyase, Fe-S type, tartrate/fumarate subfamily [Halobacteroides halobius DSM 5150]|uniref:Hydro-lyase, Fe-S type, tartrate/fumarate subfamily n=1 Tax=Halobacteroides halobius (strain ATCC 35273 / DSM 5150 / MD-1) TaxID=748449 RepID=L0KCX9_HALHC|nr:fumarate hydratase [Halobacteroides halobius]AGB41933.1 hydro-lyase, Fe-S type, tartrate/fumarate subfamily [Halobacteroides halobius DSM 5150]
MGQIKADKITKEVTRLCQEANYNLGRDIIDRIKSGYNKAESAVAKEILAQIIENAKIAKEEKKPICQDTGMAVVFVQLGQEVEIVGDDLNKAINTGVSKGYKKGYLRKSVVDDPVFTRENTTDNTPAIIHTEVVPGDQIKITVAPKGFGSENMSQLKMLKPTAGVEGVKEFIIQTVKEAGPNPCPPIVVGVGIGGTVEKAALLAKKSLLRPLGKHNRQEKFKRLETDLLKEINQTGIGPQGLGGKLTALAVNIETFPTHIAGLPVVVNLNCHVTRHKEVTLKASGGE